VGTRTRTQTFGSEKTNQISGSNYSWNQKEEEGKGNTIFTIHHFKD
jgi:hypothetical protein